jgi:hypothetical protein
MTNTSGSILCCSRDHHRIILLSHYQDFDRSDRWESTFNVQPLFHRVFFKPDPVGFEAGRDAEGPVFLEACCKYNFLSYSCSSA